MFTYLDSLETNYQTYLNGTIITAIEANTTAIDDEEDRATLAETTLNSRITDEVDTLNNRITSVNRAMDTRVSDIEAKYVSKYGEQTIQGTKTFEDGRLKVGSTYYRQGTIQLANNVVLGLPNTSGIIALTSDIEASSDNDRDYTVTYVNTEVGKIISGTYTAKKASQDDNGDVISTTYVKHGQVVNALTSTDTTNPLSANQGRILKNYIDSINAILSSDEVDLDTIQEIVDYIQTNKSIIDYLGENKIDYTDIIDNLTTTTANKVLSANQGKVLKGLIDAIVSGSTIVGNATHATNADNATNANHATSADSATDATNATNATYATYATYDSDGNKIDETYYTHEEGFAIGLVSVTNYDESTGLVTLEYNNQAITTVNYDDSTGIISFTY